MLTNNYYLMYSAQDLQTLATFFAPRLVHASAFKSSISVPNRIRDI